MAETNVKEEARRIVDRLPDDATRADLAHLVGMHERLAQGRKDSAEGRVYSLEEIEREHGFTS